MAEPLRIILIVSAIGSGIYSIIFIKNAVLTSQLNPQYILQIMLSFVAIASFGLIIWGIVALGQRAARKMKSSGPKVRQS
jgi:hypothetical protein